VVVVAVGFVVSMAGLVAVVIVGARRANESAPAAPFENRTRRVTWKTWALIALMVILSAARVVLLIAKSNETPPAQQLNFNDCGAPVSTNIPGITGKVTMQECGSGHG
jgi:heme/copper-type cytochrome/quinol oxidase subunit 2